jgi:hypothetical protein
LHVARDFRLLQIAERLAQLVRSLALRCHQITHGVLHALFELLDLVHLRLMLIRKLAGLLARHVALCLVVSAAQVAFELLLLARHFIGLLGELFDLIGRLLVAQAGEHLRSFFQAIGGALGLGVALHVALLLRVAHLLLGLSERIQRLLELLGAGSAQALILALLLLALLVLLTLLTALGHLAQLLLHLLVAGLSLLTLLALLAGLSLLTTLLAGLSLLTLLTLLALLALLPLLALLLALLAVTAELALLLLFV